MIKTNTPKSFLYVPEKGTENWKFNVFYNTLSQTFQSIRFCNHNKKLSLSYLNAEVLYSLVWCLDDAEDVLKHSSTPNYMDFGANLVKIGHRSPEIEKLESFEEDGQEITERPRLEPRLHKLQRYYRQKVMWKEWYSSLHKNLFKFFKIKTEK